MRPGPALVLGLTWLVAFNLRSGLIGIGPVLPALTVDLALSHTQASILVAVPTAMMGVGAVPGGRLADRWGAARLIAVGVALVAGGGALRGVASAFAPLVALTVLFGIGIGIAQPALPRLARAWFPGRLGVVTGIYASGLVSGSIVAASLTAPVLLSLTDGRSWRSPLAIWGGVALLTLVAWVAVMRPWRGPRPPILGGASPPSSPQDWGASAPWAGTNRPRWSPWRDRGAWLVATLFAGQGVAYYLLVAWLPAIYADLGLGDASAGALYATFNAATLPAILGFPALSDRIGRRRLPAAVAGALFVAGALGLAVAPLAEPWRWLWAALAGAGVSGVFAMSLILPADVAPLGRTGATAGMVLGIGYAASALGPILAGGVRDATGSFQSATLMLPVLGLVLVGLSLAVPELPRRRFNAETVEAPSP